jgi:hypothetical protein
MICRISVEMDTPSAHEFAWTVKQAVEALLAANDRDPFDAKGRPVGNIEVEGHDPGIDPGI